MSTTEIAIAIDVAAALPSSATADGFHVKPHTHWVTDEPGYRAALDCNVLSAVLTGRGRSAYVLNHLAYAHLIPVIDGGLSIFAPTGR